MNIANFLYRTTGRNIHKPVAPAVVLVLSVADDIPSTSILKSDQPEMESVIYIGPRGGRYRLDAKGRKVYVRAA